MAYTNFCASSFTRNRRAFNLVTIGAWLFRNRGWLPVPLVVGLLVFTRPLSLWTGLGLGMMLLGPLVRVWAITHMGSTARNRDANVQKLVYTGPYELTRNPLYMANIWIHAGLGVASCGPLVGACVGFGYFIFYSFIVRFEESFLERRLGEIFRSYRNRVPRWIGEAAPVHAAAPKGILSQRIATALRAERTTLIVTAIVTLMVLIRSVILG